MTCHYEEHMDFERGAENMELRAMHLEAEQEAQMEADMDERPTFKECQESFKKAAKALDTYLMHFWSQDALWVAVGDGQKRLARAMADASRRAHAAMLDSLERDFNR